VRLRLLILAGAVSGVVACASLVGLDSSDDPSVDGQTPDGTDAGGTVEGDGAIVTEGGLTILPASIDIKGVRCGESKTVPITIVNGSNGPLPFEIYVSQNDVFSLESADNGVVKGDVASKERRIVNLIAKSPTAGNASTDIVVRAGETVQQISATFEARGAGLVVTPTVLDFGEVREGTASTEQNVLFSNDGNDAITITDFKSDGTAFVLPTNVTIAAGSSQMAKFSMKNAALDPAVVTNTLTPQFSGVQLCGATPTLQLKGQHTNQSVIVTPLTLDLGRGGCKTAPAGKSAKFTITNFSGTNVNYTLTPKAGTKYAFDKPLTGIINGNAPPLEVTVTVPNAGTQFGDLDEDLRVEVGNAPAGPVDKTIKLHMVVFGAVLEIRESGWPCGFGSTCQGLRDLDDNETGYGTVRNVGNADVCVVYKANGGQPTAFTPESEDKIERGETDDLRVRFDVSQDGDYSTTFSVVRTDTCPSIVGGGESAPFCVDPPTVQVSGRRDRD